MTNLNILDFLPTGEENAIPAKQLAAHCGFRSVRDLQKAIEALRLNGEIIASTCQNGGGYFIPKDERELRAYVHTVERRATNSFRSLQGAKQALQEMESGRVTA